MNFCWPFRHQKPIPSHEADWTPLRFIDLQKALVGKKDDAAVVAIQQLAKYLRASARSQHEGECNVPAPERDYCAGQAASMNTLLDLVKKIVDGDAEKLPNAVKLKFGWTSAGNDLSQSSKAAKQR